MQPIKYYLPDEIFILLSTLGYALCVRILDIDGHECTGADSSGLILWLFLVAMFVVVFVSKYLDSKDIGISLAGGLIAFCLGLGLHKGPLDCVIKSRRGMDWVRILQSIFVGVPLLLYCLVLFGRRRL
ncbi:uncharacterized protein LOC134824438 [Bolinopsis microptera]|uniref:uncharacterized protein LOC134824438 n=1 Tax=Bolinopsis microptera TaxID=2820187 RepID=UPI00307AFAB6